MKIIICTIKSWNIELAEKFRKESGHEVLVLTNKAQLTAEAVGAFSPEYIFFPHWSYIIPADIYDNFNCVVFHMADLPFGRGGSPLQNLIVRGYDSTVISALKVTAVVDGGPIYLKHPLSLEGSATEIFIRAAHIIFEKLIPAITAERMEPGEQEGEVVEFKRRTPEQSRLTEDLSLKQLYDYIRMLDAEGYPQAFLDFGHYRLSFSGATKDDDRISCRVEIREVKSDE